MNEPIDAVIVRPGENTAVARVQDKPMSVEDIVGQVKLIQEVMKKVMTEGEHYGTIPGCGNKKTLLQPGAQKLTMTFRLAPEYQIQETNFPGGHKEYRVICTLKSASGNFVGQGVGCCSTLESKYRWRGGARKCPECGKETIIKGKAEYGGGWLCFAKKGGCGAKWEDGAEVIENQSIDRVENDSPADFYNTVLKMAKKRGFVDATITATAASDIFTQDIGDDEGDTDAPKTPQDAPKPANVQTPAPAKKAAAKPKSEPAATTTDKGGSEAHWRTYLETCKNRLLQLVAPDTEWAWWRYGQDRDWILPTESLLNARAEKVFEGYERQNAKDSIKAIFDKHQSSVSAMAANTPPEMREEILRGMVPMLAGSKPAAPKKAAGCCVACNSTATKKHDDLIGVTWCEKCGTQWQDGSTVAYEEHDWMFAKLPFAPKDAEKKYYKGMTLGQISRLDSKYWFGIVMNFTAEPYQGRPPSETSLKFAEACEKARQHLKKAAGETDTANPPDDNSAPADDDVPF